jgi:sugar lactone lactonase YvrE
MIFGGRARSGAVAAVRRACLRAALVMLALAACGDPIIVLGDPPGMMRIVAGMPALPGTTLDSLATRSRLREPNGIVVDQAGVLYIADVSGRILAVRSDGTIELLASASCGTPPCLDRPEHMALDGRGGLIIADGRALRVFRLDLATRQLEVLAGTGASGVAVAGAPALASSFSRPTGVAVANDGLVYFTDRGGHRVWRIGPDGTLEAVAGTGEPGNTGDDGAAVSARLLTPMGLAHADGILYVAEWENARVRGIDLTTGRIAAVAGSGLPAYGGDGGAALAAHLRMPEGIAVTADGRHLFIADRGNNRVRRVDLARGTINTFAGTGNDEFTGSELSGGETGLSRPVAVATGPHGFVFIADTGHHIVWRALALF